MGHGSGSTIPAETVRVAWAASPKGTPAMLMRDRLRDLFVDGDFAGWYSTDGRRGVSPARLALVSILQYAENLTDRQAARAVACRLDWKYALGMELTEPGFDHSVLSEFRDRLAEGDHADQLLALMTDRLAAAGLVKRRGRQRTDSTHVLAAVRRLSRVELVGETLRAALEAITVVDDQWLAPLITPEWVGRYGDAVHGDWLTRHGVDLAAYVLQVGVDGMTLLQAVYRNDTPAAIARLAQVETLRQVWVQQYFHDSDGRLCWRQAKISRARKAREGKDRRGHAHDDDSGAATVPWSRTEIVSPHDPQARYARKLGKVEWIGYKDHQTETCDDDQPRLIVNVVTTPAPEQDWDVLPLIHQALDARAMAPAEHLVDGGYVTPYAIHHASTDHAITVTGPVKQDPRAAERPGFAKHDFRVNWADHTATCPQGVTSPPFKPTTMDGRPAWSVLFRRRDCHACDVRLRCTGNIDNRGRHILLMPQPIHQIQIQARHEQQTTQWHQRYALRAGCEATISETVRAHGLRHCRYRGLAKTHVQHVLTAAGTNLIRLSQHQHDGRKPRSASPFQRLCQRLAPETITDSA